jgi:DNA repair protein RadA/Sms
MGEEGMSEVLDPSAVLLGDHRAVAGTAVLPAMEGSRPLLLELQALASRSQYGLPRRAANGLDPTRLHMIVAVLEKRAQVNLHEADVHVNVAGGLRVQEPAADLPVALAIASSLRDRPLPAETVVIGELGLAGEVRRVGRMERRLQEAARRGFVRAIVPKGSTAAAPPGMELVEVGDLIDAVNAFCKGRERGLRIAED